MERTARLMGTSAGVGPMKTYTMLDSTAIDLSALTEEEQAYLRSCETAYR